MALSETETVRRLVPAGKSLPGRQVNTPFVGLMLAPAGAPEPRLNERRFAGRSESRATNGIVTRMPLLMIWPGTESRIGGWFTSLTNTVTFAVALRLGTPLSFTRTCTRFVLGPLPSPVTHEIAPLFGFSVTPAGADRS